MSPLLVLLVGSIALLSLEAVAEAEVLNKTDYRFGPFNSSYYAKFKSLGTATISNGALQLTPDSLSASFSLQDRWGGIFFNHVFKMWHEVNGTKSVASFNTSFLINMFRLNSSISGEGLTFLIAPDPILQPGSYGKYLGLTNPDTDGSESNQIVAVEFDSSKQEYDPDNFHVGLDINSIKSVKAQSLSPFGIQLTNNGTRFYVVWIQYDGQNKSIEVYMTEQEDPDAPTPSRPSRPVLEADLDISSFVNNKSYLGFSGSTGDAVQLHAVLRWNLTMEVLPGDKDNKDDKDNKLAMVLAVGIPALVLLLLLILGFAGLGFYWNRRQRALEANILGALRNLPGMPREFRYKDLKRATNNFNQKQKLGAGGFGVVYRGILPKETLEIAVKKFSRDNIQGKDDFLAELTIINRLRHKHLVRLLGWCHTNGMLLLVYEFMPNGSLDKHLFCSPENPTLNWSHRYKIITGVASALHYLHNDYDQRVIHRDLKASNIMLDSNFNARLGDFGLARALENEKTSYAELEGVPGTIGYIAPECVLTGKATCESDVYGFGAVLLEVVCGQRPWTKLGEFEILVDWVWIQHRERRILEAVDKRLGDQYDAGEAERLLLLGLACSHPAAGERPKTEAILQILGGSMAVPHVPPFKPPFVWHSVPGRGRLGIISGKGNSAADSIPLSETPSKYLSWGCGR